MCPGRALSPAWLAGCIVRHFVKRNAQHVGRITRAYTSRWCPVQFPARTARLMFARTSTCARRSGTGAGASGSRARHCGSQSPASGRHWCRLGNVPDRGGSQQPVGGRLVHLGRLRGRGLEGAGWIREGHPVRGIVSGRAFRHRRHPLFCELWPKIRTRPNQRTQPIRLPISPSPDNRPVLWRRLNGLPLLGGEGVPLMEGGGDGAFPVPRSRLAALLGVGGVGV
jgi:hypothetical protein